MSATTPARFPLNTLAIPLGLTGLADLWSDAAAALGMTWPVDQVLWAVAGIAWIVAIVAHTVRGRRSADGLASQLTHAVQGPLAALVPIVGMLLGIDLLRFSPIAGTVLAVTSLVAAALFAGWLIASWTAGGLSLESLHGGYFLPTVAAGYIGARTAADLHAEGVAIGLFVVATFFWIAMFTLLIGRLAFRSPLPDPLVPTTAILMAPPAVAAAAWFTIDGGRVDAVEDGLAALAVLMVLVQLGPLPRYRRLRFSLGFWSFTFPTAAMAELAVARLELQHPVGWQGLVIAVTAGTTALVGWIAVRSVLLWRASRRSAAVAPAAQLTQADDAIVPAAV